MNTSRRQLLFTTFKFSDIAIVSASWLLCTVVFILHYTDIPPVELLQTAITIPDLVLFILSVAAWHYTFTFYGLYHSKRFASRRREVLDILKATCVGTVIILSALVFFRRQMATPLFVVTFWFTTTVLTILSRLVMRSVLKQFRKQGRNLRHVLIIGTNERALEFARKIRAKAELGYNLIGFMDAQWEGRGVAAERFGSDVVDLRQFPQYIREHVVDEVIVCLPLKSFYDECARIIALCGEMGVMVRLLTSFFDLKKGKIQEDQFEEFSVLTVYPGAAEGSQVLLKRLIDVAVSLALTLMLSPVFLFVALLIKATSPGPVFFVQERVGYNKRRFLLYKFRTMVAGADKEQAEMEKLNEAEGPVFKIKNDPRITPVGKFLRRTSIDEVPQLLNVLKGDMSLVGPRPLPVRDYNGFDQDWHRRRFSVRPGITCLWQVAGRSEIPFDRWMELDMQYIDHWSLWLDLKILLQTIPAVLKGHGAH